MMAQHHGTRPGLIGLDQMSDLLAHACPDPDSDEGQCTPDGGQFRTPNVRKPRPRLGRSTTTRRSLDRPGSRREGPRRGPLPLLSLESAALIDAKPPRVAPVGGLELERRVLDVEVARQAAAQLVEDGRRRRRPRSSTTCADTTFIPDVIVQACRSWTSATPGRLEDVRRARRRGRCPSGVASSSTSTASRSRRQVRGRISRPMTTEATASAAVQPVTAMTIAATMTATEPARSPMTSR